MAVAALPGVDDSGAVAPGAPFDASALGSYACAELDRAIACLARRGSHLHEGVHQARKSLRRVRAVLALGRPALGPGAELIDREIARVNRKLSRLRDAHALVETLDRLVAHDPTPEQLSVLLRVRRVAARARAARARETLAVDPVLAERRALLTTLRAALPALPWQAPTAASVREAVRLSQSRVDLAGAQAHATGRDADWHRWRRRVRRLSQQHRALGDLLPELTTSKKSCKALAERLGEAQDYSLLRDHTGRRSLFAEPDRRVLRALADEGTRRVRERIGPLPS